MPCSQAVLAPKAVVLRYDARQPGMADPRMEVRLSLFDRSRSHNTVPLMFACDTVPFELAEHILFVARLFRLKGPKSAFGRGGAYLLNL